VRSTIDLARNLGKQVVAEGVEQPESCSVLRSSAATCPGYFVSKPCPPQTRCWLAESAGLLRSDRHDAGARRLGSEKIGPRRLEPHTTVIFLIGIVVVRRPRTLRLPQSVACPGRPLDRNHLGRARRTFGARKHGRSGARTVGTRHGRPREDSFVDDPMGSCAAQIHRSSLPGDKPYICWLPNRRSDLGPATSS